MSNWLGVPLVTNFAFAFEVFFVFFVLICVYSLLCTESCIFHTPLFSNFLIVSRNFLLAFAFDKSVRRVLCSAGLFFCERIHDQTPKCLDTCSFLYLSFFCSIPALVWSHSCSCSLFINAILCNFCYLMLFCCFDKLLLLDDSLTNSIVSIYL